MKPSEKKKRGIYLTPQERRQLNFERSKEILEEKYNQKLDDIQVRYLEKGIRYILYFDIETSNFDPEQQFIICYNCELRDVLTGKIEKYESHITRADIAKAVKENNFNFDYKVLQKLAKCFESADMLVGHYSTKFDYGYFKSRCLLTHQKELIPQYMKLRHSDTWRLMKDRIKAKRNTLDTLIRITTGKSQKTHVDLEYWYKVHFKDSPDWQKSMDYIVDHCRKDVTMTRKAHMIIEPFSQIIGGYA